jgi:hypothetical protein
VPNAIEKAKKALHAIMLIKKCFNKMELKQFLMAKFYTILWYNADIWLLPSLNQVLKKQLLTATAKTLKLCTPTYHYLMSYETPHELNTRTPPIQMMT